MIRLHGSLGGPKIFLICVRQFLSPVCLHLSEVSMMSAESDYNPYHPYHTLHLAPSAAQYSDSESRANPRSKQTAKTLSDFPDTQKQRVWILLIVPSVFLLIVAGLLCFMVLWLLYHSVRANASFGSIAKDALIVDEAAQWCRLMRATIANAKCDPSSGPIFLGLTFAGLLVGFVYMVKMRRAESFCAHS